MIKKIENELRDFKIGAELPKKTGSIGTRNITVSQASKAVGGNFAKNFFQRIKLFFGVGEKKEWFRKANIEGRLSRLDTKELHRLNSLFTLCFPDEQKIEDKKLVKLMDNFVRPKLYQKGLEDFFGDEDPALYHFPKDNKIALNNILKLAEAGIDLQTLKTKTTSSEPLDLRNLAHKEAGQVLLNLFGLTQEYAAQVENFATHPALQTELFRVLTDTEKENLAKLMILKAKDVDFVRSIKPDATAEEIPGIFLRNLEDTQRVVEFLHKFSPISPSQIEPNELKLLQFFTPKEEFQSKLYKTLSEEEFKNMTLLVDAGVTAEEFAAFILGKTNPKKTEKTVLENLMYEDSVQDCVALLSEKKFSKEMSEALFTKLPVPSQTEENKKFLENFFSIPPIPAAKKEAMLASKDAHLAENIVAAISYKYPLHYNDLQKFLSTHPEIPAQDPLEALTTHFAVFKEKLYEG